MTKLSVRDSIGDALRFTRENWRFVFAVAGLGALAHVAALMTGSLPFVMLAALVFVSAAIYAALTRAALSGPASVRASAIGDVGRVAGSGAIVGGFGAIVAVVSAYVAMAVLIAPYAEEAQRLKEDRAALEALMQRAASEQPSVILWALVIGGVLLLLLTSRLYLSAPASVDRARISVFESWGWTKGNLLRIAAARVVLLGPAVIFAGALQSLAGMGLGLGMADPVALAQSAQARPGMFILFYGLAQFMQIAVFTALEAGLSVAIYRRLAPPKTG
jgi:hypothetical protein